MRRIGLAAALFALVLFFRFGLPVRAARGHGHPRDLITTAINDNQRIVLRGNTRWEANRHNDRGPVPDHFKLEHMLLQLRRPAELQQEFDTYVDGLTRSQSANFHQWLAPAEVGDQYGLSDADLLLIKFWLRVHGIRVNYVYPNRVLLDVSATARQIRETFRADIHFLDVNGVRHYANMNDPEIPTALAPAIAGIVSLSDFRPHSMLRMRPRYTYTDTTGTYQAVTPADLAAIYNLNPLFSQGITGAGQTIAIVEDTDPFTLNDWSAFETKFQLTKYGGPLPTLTHPNLGGNCVDPGVNGDDGELALDIEYAAAAAPGASLQLATCVDLFAAITNLINATPHPYIISVSYNECEAFLGAGSNAFISSTYQMAASEGISIFVSSGDEGPASCDAGGTAATHGITVGGLSSTAFNVSVGGTDFIDTFNNNVSTYWTSTNGSVLQSANGYIPEIPWNNSCASILVAQFYGGTTTPFGATGFCNTTTGRNFFRTTSSGSGGPSGCATGTATTSGVVSGSCAGYQKPTWQAGLFGNPNDGVRDQPDVSLFAANGIWNHFYVFCYTDTANGGAPCTGNPDPTASPASSATWSAAGGTSFAAPILAGIQALVNQRTSALTRSPVPGQGNPNPVYYSIAASEYGPSGSSLCNSSNQPLPRRGVSTSCVFYDVTQGDLDLNCTNGSPNCFGGAAGNVQGVLVTGAVSGLTFTGGAGYASAPACTISAPHNSGAYNGYTGGVQATCTATISGGSVNSVTLNNPGAGYAPIPLCTLTGGGGSGATCTVSGVTKAAYQPSFPATPGWDFATGIGTINVYNLVFSPVWVQGP